jgi:large subunit ribosomal protein L24
VDAEMYIDISNVQVVCPSCGRPTRVGHLIHPDGKKVRVCRKCDTEI